MNHCRRSPLRHVRRTFLGVLAGTAMVPVFSQTPVAIADRLELFTDDHLIERLSGGAKKVLQKPEPKEVVFTADAPWEGNSSAYFTVFQDGDMYRMYYRGSQAVEKIKEEKEGTIPAPDDKLEVSCLAVSRDGIHWTRPKLNVFDWNGQKENNIVWMGTSAAHNFAPFKDANPAADPAARYKAVGGKGGPRAFQSADGESWQMVADRSLVTKGTFDSQNLTFWDAVRGEYRFYWRINPNSVRGIRTAVSKDFKVWENMADLTFPGKPDPDSLAYGDRVQLYTNAVQPYFRAPHLFIGFPTQFIQKGKQTPPKFYQTQPLFMSSRDGVVFDRWDEPVIPTSSPADREGNRANYMAWGLLRLPDTPDELSVYATEAGGKAGPTRVRRFVYRLDGFVSVSAGPEGGELLTKPLLFEGDTLILNYQTRTGGSVRLEIQDEYGKAIKGLSLDDCEPLTGDSVKAVVQWQGKARLGGKASGQPVRIRCVLADGNLFSLRVASSK